MTLIERNTIVFLLLFLCSSLSAVATPVATNESFNVRLHLSTVSSYEAGKETTFGSYVPSTIPEGCSPIHLNLLARHGTRSPTKKRIKELDQLSIRLDDLLNQEKHGEESLLNKIPSWLAGWQSPWKGRQKGGELISKGEDELYQLALRIRKRFPELFNEEYHPDIFSIRATQVPRASASAVAFGIGLFQGNGTLGPGTHRAFSVTSESRASDICLRFYDACETYKEYRKSQEPAVEKLKEPIFEEIAAKLVQHYELNFTRQDVSSLWFLCKQEASLLDITDQACSLFTAYEVELLEWTDDLELFILKGYGKSINYLMGLPLLQDVVQSMEEAILAKEENHKPGTFEKARLRFAHAETVVPFSCLLGIFLQMPEFELIQRDEPLSLPPKPPQPRNWRGSTVAPFGVNIMLVLYQCPGNISRSTAESRSYKSKYYLQALHNEIPAPMPGCGYKDICDFEVFKENIVNTHLKQNFQTVCSVKAKEELPPPEHCSIACRLRNFIRNFFPKDSHSNTKANQKNEL